MEKITLGQLVQYFKDDGEDIQISFEDQEWDQYEQISMDSRMLKPYLDYEIKCMGLEVTNDTKEDILRVTIGKGKI